MCAGEKKWAPMMRSCAFILPAISAMSMVDVLVDRMASGLQACSSSAGMGRESNQLQGLLCMVVGFKAVGDFGSPKPEKHVGPQCRLPCRRGTCLLTA